MSMIQKALAAISKALLGEKITTQDAKRLRMDMGVSQAYFTKKRPTTAQRKSRQQMQKASRRINRGLGKGQKRSP